MLPARLTVGRVFLKKLNGKEHTPAIPKNLSIRMISFDF